GATADTRGRPAGTRARRGGVFRERSGIRDRDHGSRLTAITPRIRETRSHFPSLGTEEREQCVGAMTNGVERGSMTGNAIRWWARSAWAAWESCSTQSTD